VTACAACRPIIALTTFTQPAASADAALSADARHAKRTIPISGMK
jgi:hypothetical protein